MTERIDLQAIRVLRGAQPDRLPWPGIVNHVDALLDEVETLRRLTAWGSGFAKATAELLEERDTLRAKCDRLEGALEKIVKCESQYSNDPMLRAQWAAEYMQSIATATLEEHLRD